MDKPNIDELIDAKLKEIDDRCNNKTKKNEKMINDPSKLDYYSNKTLNLINATLEKKRKSSKAYQKALEKELTQ
jgi:hypothetical protein